MFAKLVCGGLGLLLLGSGGCGGNASATDAPGADALRDAFESIPIGPDVLGDDGPVRGVVVFSSDRPSIRNSDRTSRCRYRAERQPHR